MVPTPTSRLTVTPATKMSYMNINSRSSDRIKPVNCRRPSVGFNDRMSSIYEDDDIPEHPNLTMVLGQNKITFDQLMKDHPPKTPIMLMSDEESTEDELDDSSHAFTPDSQPLSPDNNLSLRTDDDDDDDDDDEYFLADRIRMRQLADPHYDPDFDFTEGIYIDPLPLSKQNDNQEWVEPDYGPLVNIENVAPDVWTKVFGQTTITKTPAGYVNIYRSEPPRPSPLQEITVDQNRPLYEDIAGQSTQHTTKKILVSDRIGGMRIMRSLSPTRDSTRKGKAPMPSPPSKTSPTPTKSSSSSSSSGNKLHNRSYLDMSSSRFKTLDEQADFFLL
ncbi:uncharacterized protein BX664DRAFT_19184 [Halteromyces radiatus]|uniref:uncharacterized protein n=1 Tax=Halteromyces radiatus TaxID=101107 RepID=UPI00221ED369|nr:uncharacterized protein BX664DRAFT_19184 [Halteromyces radiatus]KAI8099349.1 hypothetical protein BX664DRAFT_19184 [Halteromyces radiatus]